MTTTGRIRTYLIILMIPTENRLRTTYSIPLSGGTAAAAAALELEQQQSLPSNISLLRQQTSSSNRELSKHRHRHHNHEKNEQHNFINNKDSGIINSDDKLGQGQEQTPSHNNKESTKSEDTIVEQPQSQQQQQQQQQLQSKETNERPNIDYSIYACDELPNLQQNAHSSDNSNTSLFDQCKFAMNCNDGDGILFSNFFFCNNDDNLSSSTPSSSHHPLFLITTLLALLLLLLALLLLFRLLSSTTDEFFSPGLEMFSLRLGLPPRFAGVTLLALGNGAPDVAATMNAMLAGSRSVGAMENGGGGGREGYGMALGELTGTCMFNICLILGAIVIYLGGDGGGGGDVSGMDKKKNGDKQRGNTATTTVRGVPCQGPLLRDIFVLILVCVVSMTYLKRGVIDHEFVYAMFGIYVSYVLVVICADAYHIFYHIPLLAEALRRGSSRESGFSLNGSTQSDDEKEGASDVSVAGEQTPLTALPSLRCDSNHRHLHHRNSSSSSLPPHHRHTIGESVIEAMSNYSCAENSMLVNHAINGVEGASVPSLRENEGLMIKTEGSIGWAPILDDGNEPLVIFHPNHAVHPHHHQHFHKPSDGPVLFLRSDSSTGHSPATRRSTLLVEDCREATLMINAPPLSTPTATLKSEVGASCGAVDIGCFPTSSFHSAPTHQINSNRPNSWKEAWSSNLQEFVEHWHDFFTDIYINESNSTWDVIFLSLELPFTIARKLTNPVPCDGYYCRPLVAVSISLSPVWLWFYFFDQFDVDIYSYNIGYVVLTTALGMSLVVIRYAPGGEGPMDLYMVIPLTLYGFAVAATWIDSIANKLVEILELFGILLRIPSTILGLTVLAFGNSVQDLVANLTLSKKGLSTMATTACFAGPIFNLCAGLGLGFWALMKSTGRDEIHVELPRNIATGFMFAIANCILIIVAGVVVGKGVIGRGYGYAACGMYAVYVLTSLYI